MIEPGSVWKLRPPPPNNDYTVTVMAVVDDWVMYRINQRAGRPFVKSLPCFQSEYQELKK